MYQGFLANSTKQSTKWLPERMCFIVICWEILVSEDYLYDKPKGKLLTVSHVCTNICCNKCLVTVVM